MKHIRYLNLLVFLFWSATMICAQSADPPSKHRYKWEQNIVPLCLISYGALSLHDQGLSKFHRNLSFKLGFSNPTKHNYTDNYLQYAPATVVLGLNAAGVQGKNKFGDAMMIGLLSNAIVTALVGSVKSFSHELRPDGSAYNSFPSGHTASAFAGAELLYQEYKDRSVWYGIAGYACATATGYFRIQNNRHWFNDVAAGAGVGILSTKLAYLIYPQLQRLLFSKKDRNTVIVPVIGTQSQGIGIVHIIR